MNQGDDKIMEALATSGAELQPKEGWQDEVRRAIRRQAPQPVRKRSWLAPAMWGGLVTAMTLMLVLFLNRQSDNRADAKAAEEAQALATSDATKEIRALAASSAALKVESETLQRELVGLAKEVKLALETQEMDAQLWAALDAVASADSADTRVMAKKTLTQVMEKFRNKGRDREILSAMVERKNTGKRAIAETALELLKLKRRAEQQLKLRRQHMQALAQHRAANAKAAAKAKKRAERKKYNKCANSSDPLCGI